MHYLYYIAVGACIIIQSHSNNIKTQQYLQLKWPIIYIYIKYTNIYSLIFKLNIKHKVIYLEISLKGLSLISGSKISKKSLEEILLRLYQIKKTNKFNTAVKYISKSIL